MSATAILSASLLCGQAAIPAFAVAAKVDVVKQDRPALVASDRTYTLPRPIAMLTPPPLASTAASAASGVAAVVEEAEELAVDVFHFFQHGVEAMGSTVHHLQVVHALERLEGVPLNQVVDLELLKAAIHPTDSFSSSGEQGEEEHPVSVASRRLDAALDQVAEWRLREVVDVGKLANALQDVPYTDPLDSRALQRDAPRIRRAVHWDAMTDAVRPPALRQALAALGTGGGGPFSELDMRAAVSAVRMDTVRRALAPPQPADSGRGHSLSASGMWTWDSM